MKILAGTSGYAFKEWKGPFYPEDLKDSGFLSFYASKFPTVEINNTFYQLPKEKTLLDWASKVPEEFSFTMKASQRITHFARLKSAATEHFTRRMATLRAGTRDRFTACDIATVKRAGSNSKPKAILSELDGRNPANVNGAGRNQRVVSARLESAHDST